MYMHYIALNDLKKYLFKKSEVSVQTVLVCNVIDNLAEHGIHCLPCSYTNVTETSMTSY